MITPFVTIFIIVCIWAAIGGEIQERKNKGNSGMNENQYRSLMKTIVNNKKK